MLQWGSGDWVYQYRKIKKLQLYVFAETKNKNGGILKMAAVKLSAVSGADGTIHMSAVVQGELTGRGLVMAQRALLPHEAA